jgi:hypothetical protein
MEISAASGPAKQKNRTQLTAETQKRQSFRIFLLSAAGALIQRAGIAKSKKGRHLYFTCIFYGFQIYMVAPGRLGQKKL